MKRLRLWLFGRVSFAFHPEDAPHVLSRMAKAEIPGDGYFAEDVFCVDVTLFRASAFRALLEAEEISFEEKPPRGLPARLRKYRRPGLIFGALLFCAVLFLSGRLIWRIEVTGCERLDEQAVLAMVREEGVDIGKPAPASFSGIAARCVAKNGGISWMGIRMEGTTVKIRVLETTPGAPEAESFDGCNLVAMKDGVVRVVDASRGRVLVKPGDVVKKGDILVSGVIPAAHGTLFAEAEGRVLGEVTETFSVELPLSEWKKEYGSTVCGGIRVKILGFSINIFKYTGNLPPTYDTIRLQESLRLGDTVFPISYIREEYLPYEGRVSERTPAQAEAYARTLLLEEIALAVKDGEILSFLPAFETRDGVCRASCTVTYLSDIAEASAFDVR